MFETSGFYGSYSMIFWEYRGEKSFIQRPKIIKNMQIGANADINMDKNWWISDACNVNKWYIYNSITGTDKKCI